MIMKFYIKSADVWDDAEKIIKMYPCLNNYRIWC